MINDVQHPPLVALIGPTGVGKTALAIALAQTLGGEIVGADSRQVYRRLAIGTAKPSAAERAAAPHHLVDIVEPDEPFSLATYHDLAMAAIEDITARGRLPLLVGGTGQYLAAILEGWQIPRVAPDWALRAELEALAADEGVAAVYARLQAVDPAAGAAIAPTNLRRMIRALEVQALTGQPISEQQRREPPPYRMVTLWLDQERALLYPRLDARVDAMVAAGLQREVADLLAAGYDWSLPAMSSLGYREWQPFFAGSATAAACIERLKFNTHNFVRKQASWFRRLPHLVNIDAASPRDAALAALEAALG